jgi:hypothetical protein
VGRPQFEFSPVSAVFALSLIRILHLWNKLFQVHQILGVGGQGSSFLFSKCRQIYGLKSTAFVVLLFPSLIPSRLRPNTAALEDEDEDEGIGMRSVLTRIVKPACSSNKYNSGMINYSSPRTTFASEAWYSTISPIRSAGLDFVSFPAPSRLPNQKIHTLDSHDVHLTCSALGGFRITVVLRPEVQVTGDGSL